MSLFNMKYMWWYAAYYVSYSIVVIEMQELHIYIKDNHLVTNYKILKT